MHPTYADPTKTRVKKKRREKNEKTAEEQSKASETHNTLILQIVAQQLGVIHLLQGVS
jgi:hypothetical protein